MIEAFPNTFMGVLLPEGAFAKWSKKSGKSKSDWLYEQVTDAGMFRRLLSGLDLSVLAKQFEAALRHDERAALICLLTAAFAFRGQAVVVGDPDGGWFWLPPKRYWDPWASDGLERNLTPKFLQRFPNIDRWSDSNRNQAEWS